MRAGKLRRLLTYQTKVQVKDSYNQPQGVWTDQTSVWGSIRSPNGREALNAGQQKASVSHIVTTRYPGFLFDPKGRFLLDSRIFNITSVLNVDERNRQVDVSCQEQLSPPVSP